jgi:hypothetical protein
VFRAYENRRFQARIYGVLRNDPNLRLYVTDATGRVLFDSRGRDVGKDYSRWLDVSRTLRGEYGARTTRETANENSSVMYVAAPIVRDGAIVGVLSVGKPARSFQGFIDLTRAKAWESAIWLFVLALLLPALHGMATGRGALDVTHLLWTTDLPVGILVAEPILCRVMLPDAVPRAVSGATLPRLKADVQDARAGQG